LSVGVLAACAVACAWSICRWIAASCFSSREICAWKMAIFHSA